MLGSPQADDARQALSRAGARNDPEPEFRLAELRGIRSDAQIARERKLAAAAERIAVDRRDRRTRKAVDLCEERRVDRGEPFIAAALADVVDVGPRDERGLTGAGDDHHADRVVAGKRLQRGAHGADGLEIEGVLDVGAIDDDRGDRLGYLGAYAVSSHR